MSLEETVPPDPSEGSPANPHRRSFLQKAAMIGASAAIAKAAAGVEPVVLPLTNVGADTIPRKPLGKTGVQLSVIGMGGYSLADAPTLDEAKRMVAEAIEAGVNFFDNAWEYHEGRSEEWMGKALRGKRDKVFLMTKVCTHGRSKSVAMEQLNDSLLRLDTDHLDLWQIHECVYYNDPERHFMPDGVVEALDAAKKAGKVRFVGFTGHKDPEIHLKMLSYKYPFDTVQMPLNVFDATYRSFEQRVLPEANRLGIGALGMKSLCGGGQPIFDMPVTVEQALRYAMSLPVATTISGMDSLTVMKQNLAVARGFKPYTSDEMDQLRKRCAPAAADGHMEMYKSTKKFDADVGRQQHGYPPPKELPL